MLMGLAIFAWGAVDYFRIERKPANAIDVQVVGKQWMLESPARGRKT